MLMISAGRFVLSACCMPGTVSGTGATVMEQAKSLLPGAHTLDGSSNKLGVPRCCVA